MRPSPSLLRHPAAMTVIAGVLLLGCSGPGDRPPRRDPATTTRSLIYLKRSTLFSFDLSARDSHRLARLPSADVAVSPGGTEYAFVEETAGGDPVSEGFNEPVIHVASIDGARRSQLGAGRSPTWSPDGSSLAAVSNAPGRLVCDAGELAPEVVAARTAAGRCVKAERVVVYDVRARSHPRERTALGADVWSLLGWTSADRILATSLRDGTVMVSSTEGARRTRKLSFDATQLWGVSPRDPTLLVASERTAWFATFEGRRLVEVSLRGAAPGDGAWAPDGRAVAVTLVRRTGPLTVRTRLALIDTKSGDVRRVPRSQGAQGQVVWDASGEKFAYARTKPNARATLQAILCDISLECEPLFSWKRGVALLALSDLRSRGGR